MTVRYLPVKEYKAAMGKEYTGTVVRVVKEAFIAYTYIGGYVQSSVRFTEFDIDEAFDVVALYVKTGKDRIYVGAVNLKGDIIDTTGQWGAVA